MRSGSCRGGNYGSGAYGDYRGRLDRGGRAKVRGGCRGSSTPSACQFGVDPFSRLARLTLRHPLFSVLNMEAGNRVRNYREVLEDLDQASRRHAATAAEKEGRQVDRAQAIVEVSKLGVPRAAVAKLIGMTRGRVQQILDEAGEAGAAGDAWEDPELRRMVQAWIAARPIPSAGIGLRRESVAGPHIGPGAGLMVRLTGDLEKDREDLIAIARHLVERLETGELDELVTLTDEELEVVRGNLIDSEDPAA
jgi:hypothetical protein